MSLGGNPLGVLGSSGAVGNSASEILTAVAYDPAAAITGSTSSTVPAALDTTNLRATFVAPASGKVLLDFGLPARTEGSNVLFVGVLDGASLVAVTQQGETNVNAFVSGSWSSREVVSGLTAGDTYHYDLAVASGTAGQAAQYAYGGGPAIGAYGAAWLVVWEL